MARASFTHYITDDSALGGMEIERSLRFDKANSGHLSKTFSSAGNRKVWTWSAWIRRAGNYGSSNTMFHAYDGSSSNRAQISFDTGNRLIVHQGGGGGSKGQTRTDRRFRDSNWYHIVCVANFADSTAADRVKMYVNGVLETKTIQVAFTDENGLINSNLEHELGAVGSSSNNFDGYMAEINFIDGQNLDPSYFGYSDFQTGKWRPKRYEGTYGQNGFHLEFKDNSGATATTIGKDTSGNQHNFTPANIAVSNDWQHSDSFIDTPTNTFPIMSLNTIYRVHNSNSNLHNGGLKYNCHYDNHGSVRAALTIPTSGKWYWEVRLLTSNSNATFGICPSNYSMTENPLSSSVTYPGAICYAAYSQYFRNGTNTGGVGGWGTSDTVALALDMDEKKITFYKNNSAQITLALLSGYENIPYFPMLTGGTNGGSVNIGVNFGANENWTYTPPSGFKSLCTRNLPSTSPSVYNPKKHFDTVIYTGDGATGRSVTGLQFQPDFVWIKSRASGHHGIYDSIRGVQKRVIADENGAESDVPIGSFDHNGFSFASEMYYNANSVNYVAWFWKAGGTAVSNSDGTITSSVSANQEAGCSVVTYTGTGADATVGHGLGKVPAIVMVKNRSRSVEWIFKHHKMNSGKVMYLDLNDGEDGATGSNNGIIGDLNNASTFSLSRTSNSGNYNNVNYSGENFVAYCWTEIPGYSKFGLYKGNNNSNGSFVHTGFKVGWLMIKKASGSGDWFVLDGKRSPTNEVLKSVKASTNAAETTDSNFLDFLSNGFMMRTTGSAVNQNTLIYMAFADQPFKYANAR